MQRRHFLSGALRAAVVSSLAPTPFALANRGTSLSTPNFSASDATERRDLNRHRFGVNYTPSRNWWFCWNEWDADPIQRDLDAIAALGADHLRIMLVWPFFQPNATYVSPLHLERLDQ